MFTRGWDSPLCPPLVPEQKVMFRQSRLGGTDIAWSYKMAEILYPVNIDHEWTRSLTLCWLCGSKLVRIQRFHYPKLIGSGFWVQGSRFKGYNILTLLTLQLSAMIGLFQRPLNNAQFCSSSRKARILTTGIHWVFWGLKFEPDTEIGQKGAFCKGLFHQLGKKYLPPLLRRNPFGLSLLGLINPEPWTLNRSTQDY